MIERSILTLLSVLLLANCGTSDLDVGSPTSESELDSVDPAEAELRRSATWDREFADASREFGVPSALLKAFAYAQTRYHLAEGEAEFEGQEPRFGIMALTQTQIEQAIALTQVTTGAAKKNVRENVRAAAALLRAYADERGLDRSQVVAWAPAVAQLSGIELPEASASFVRDAVFGALRAGVGAPSEELARTGQSLELQSEFSSATRALSVAPDFPGAVWRPSPNFNARPGVGPAMVVIHTCESSYAGCWSWLTQTRSGVSAHYVVNESGSQVSQLVRNASRAWHIGATYSCNNNAGTDCFRNGRSSNDFTIGIEHGGYARQSHFSAGQLDASARLACHLSKLHGIPRDRRHFVGHGQLQPYNRTDPGPNWPWSDYMARIAAHCGAGASHTPKTSSMAGSQAFVTPGQEHYFMRNAQGEIRHIFWHGANWSRGTWMAGSAGDPSAVLYGNQQHVFARSNSGELQHTFWDGNTGKTHQDIWGSGLAFDPSALVIGDAQHVWAVDGGGALRHWWWAPALNGVHVNTWATDVVGKPAVMFAAGQEHAFVRTRSGQIEHVWWTPADATLRRDRIGSDIAGDPVVAEIGAQQHVWAVDGQGRLRHFFWSAHDGWREDIWAHGVTGRPAFMLVGDAQHVFVRSVSGELRHFWWAKAHGLLSDTWATGISGDPTALLIGSSQHVWAQDVNGAARHIWWTGTQLLQNDWGH